LDAFYLAEHEPTIYTEKARIAKLLEAKPKLFRASFLVYGVTVQVVDRLEAPQLVRYRLQMGEGVKFNQIEQHSTNLRIALALPSEFVLDQPGAERLLGRGDFLCDRGKGLERGQASLISQDQFLQALTRRS